MKRFGNPARQTGRLLSRRAWATSLAAASLLLATHPAGAAEERAARIVALGGVVTEILYDLGYGDRIVAVDTTSVHPPAALATKPNVGYLRQLSAEGILSTRPTLVVAVEGAGPPDVLRLVREAGVPVVLVPERLDEAGVVERIGAVAAAVGRDPEGRTLAEGVRRRFAELAAIRQRVETPVRALFILSLQNGRAMVGGRGTPAAGILSLAGAQNAAEGVEGFRPMTDEAIVASRPDAVVMMSVGPGGAPPADLFDGPALSQTPAGRAKRLVAMNGLYLLGFGPRTPDAARELMAAFYPGLKAE